MGLCSTVTTISDLWGLITVDSGLVHSKRTDSSLAHDIVVVGDSPMESSIRELVGARRVSDKSSSPNRFGGAHAVVAAAHHSDFEVMIGRSVASRRHEAANRAEQIVIDACIAGVNHLVIVSTAMVAGAAPDRELIQDNDPRAIQPDGYIGDVVEFEDSFFAALEAVEESKRPALTILRPAAVAGPGLDTQVTRHFEAPRILVIKGVQKHWQFAHVSDIASAVQLVIDQQLYGALVVGAVKETANGFEPDQLTPQQLADVSGMRTIEVTTEMAFSTASRLHRVGILPSPATDLEMAVYPWTVMPTTLLEHGWRSQVSSETCLREIVAQSSGRLGVAGRRVGARDAAALGAAGAAVAMISTAAIWRQARGQR